MATDLLLACLHHLVVFSLVTIPAVELALMRGSVGATRIAHLARLDAIYGLLAMAILAIGFGRVYWGGKGPAFYLHNPVFWAKLGVFALAGLASAVPTVRILRWKKAVAREPGLAVPDTAVASTRRWLVAELALFVPIPVLAAAMARAVGLG